MLVLREALHDCVICYISTGTPLTVEKLLKECNSVTDWYTLGIHLGLPMSELDNIQETYHMHGVSRLKTKMFPLTHNRYHIITLIVVNFVVSFLHALIFMDKDTYEN